ncbi:MAG: hypothetical protein J5545_11060 [Bacteroidaceae bacterium]|nr:hypothetical protein [Bacteroidaceae bacterium]
MTVKEVFDLRKQGKIEEAYEAIRRLKDSSELINKEYGDDENAFDRCMEVTKRSRDYFKEAMRREDYYRNTMIEIGVESLLIEGYLTEQDFMECREELRTYILERHHHRL